MSFTRRRALLLASVLGACSADAPRPAGPPAPGPQLEAVAPEEAASSEAEPVATPAPSVAPLPAPTAAPSAAGSEAAPGYPLEGVASTLRSAKDRFLVCAELESTSPVAALRFEIDEQGKVTEANYWRGDAAIKPDARQACSLVVLRSLSFPPSPKGKLTITYPLIEEAL